MKRKRWAVPGTALATIALVGMTAGTAFADLSYTPTTLGNSSYTNQVDKLNDISVDGASYTSSISKENSETQQQASSESIQLGQATDTSTPVLVTNSLDSDITGFAVHTTATKDFGENLLSGGSIASGGTAGWNVEEGTYTESKVTDKNGVTVQVPDNYMIQATLSDGTKAVFHNVNMAGVESVELCYSKHYKVYYVRTTTLTNHTPDPDINYEVSLKKGEEANFITHTAARYAADKEITASRGGGWDKQNLKLLSGKGDFSEVLDFGVYVPLYGEPSEDYTDGAYQDLYWNPDQHLWRGTNGDAGTWKQATAPAGAGDYGDGDASKSNVDHHPGMDEGDWSYVTEGTSD